MNISSCGHSLFLSWRGSSGARCQFTGGGTTGRQLTDLMWQCHQTSHLPSQTEPMRGEHHWCEWPRCSCSPAPSSPLLAQLHHVPACSNTQSRLQLLMPDLEIHLSKSSLIPSQRSRFTFHVSISRCLPFLLLAGLHVEECWCCLCTSVVLLPERQLRKQSRRP